MAASGFGTQTLSSRMSMIAVGDSGRFTQLPDIYMRKMAVGPRARGSIDLLRPVGRNIEAIAEAFGRRVNDVTTIVLDRPRHHDLIEEIRAAGARIKLIQDGDVTASISAAIRGTNDHLAIGIGGRGATTGSDGHPGTAGIRRPCGETGRHPLRARETVWCDSAPAHGMEQYRTKGHSEDRSEPGGPQKRHSGTS